MNFCKLLLNLITQIANNFNKQKEQLSEVIPNLKQYLSVDERIALKLKLEGKAFRIEKYEHNYPHCWRTDKPVLYYPLDSWFIKITEVRDRMFQLNQEINWKPKATGEGRFGNWLENMVDWNLSRSRYWGTPLPIWKKSGAGFISRRGDKFAVGSIEELKEEGWYYFGGEKFEKLKEKNTLIETLRQEFDLDI